MSMPCAELSRKLFYEKKRGMRKTIDTYRDELLAVDPVDFLVYNFLHTPAIYVESLLFVAQEFLARVTLANWCEVLFLISSNPLALEMSALRFLNRVLLIDGFSMVLEDARVDDEAKSRVRQFLYDRKANRGYKPLTVAEKEMYKRVYHVALSDIDIIRHNLRTEGAPC